MRRLVVSVVVLAVLGALFASAPPAGADGDALAPTASKYLDRLFIVTCGYSHSSSDDPIGKPGQPGASHHHDFFGNTSTDAFSTFDSMLAAGTTCNRAGDTAGYWMPSVLEDGVPVTPGPATFYYRGPGPDPAAVQAFPEDFRMIAGDPEAATPQRLRVVEWACRDEGAKKPWRADIPQCPAGQALAFRANFPDCWNGVDLDSADHRSHVAYSGGDGRCPAAFPVHLPEIAMTVTYPGLHGGDLELSTHSPFGGHADFWNTWQPGVQAGLVESCLKAARECGDYAGPGGAAPLLESRPPAPAVPSGAASTSLVSSGGDQTTSAQDAAVSADGGWAVYAQTVGGRSEIVRRATSGGPVDVVSVSTAGAAANGDSSTPSVSADGRYVAFSSDATNLVAGDTNNARDVFVRDTLQGTTVRVTGVGGQGNGVSISPVLSDDGRYLAFTSLADNLVPGDTNRYPDVFRYALASHSLDLVSVAPGGVPADQASSSPDISADGRWVAFGSWARNLSAADTNKWSDVYVRDMTAGTPVLVSLTYRNRAANNSSYAPSISDDGQRVAYESAATDMVVGDKGARDVFVRDRSAGLTTRVSSAPYKKVAGLAAAAEISGDGSVVLFQSSNQRLAQNAAAALDVYAVCPDGSGLKLVSSGGDQPSGFPSVDRTGSVAVFESTSSTLAPGVSAGDLEVYAARLTPGC